MKLKTQHDRLVHGLLAMGADPLPKKNKYSMFKLDNMFYFVGKSGALRVASRPAAGVSIPVADRHREAIMAVAPPEIYPLRRPLDLNDPVEVWYERAWIPGTAIALASGGWVTARLDSGATLHNYAPSLVRRPGGRL